MSTFTHVLIVGGGAYGASTALELARLGHKVTVLEKSANGNAADNAASNDLNKIIRADYEVGFLKLTARTSTTVTCARRLFTTGAPTRS